MHYISIYKNYGYFEFIKRELISMRSIKIGRKNLHKLRFGLLKEEDESEENNTYNPYYTCHTLHMINYVMVFDSASKLDTHPDLERKNICLINVGLVEPFK